MLDTLKVDRAAFDALPSGKLVFSFVFGANDTLTMHGWSLHGGSKNYDSLPNIKLVKKAASLVPYGNGTYFGNVILATSDVNSIKHLLNSNNAQWVLFAPKLQGNNIVYTIFVAKNGPGTLIETKAIATGIDANPSPPKNY